MFRHRLPKYCAACQRNWRYMLYRSGTRFAVGRLVTREPIRCESRRSGKLWPISSAVSLRTLRRALR